MPPKPAHSAKGPVESNLHRRCRKRHAPAAAAQAACWWRSLPAHVPLAKARAGERPMGLGTRVLATLATERVGPTGNSLGPQDWRRPLSAWLSHLRTHRYAMATKIQAVLCAPSAPDAVPGLEHPPDHSQASRHETQRHAHADGNVHIGLAIKCPAQAADQINDWVEQRHVLPQGRQHVDAVERAT